MKLFRSMLLTLGLMTLVSASDPDPGERKVLVDHLNKSSSEFASAVTGLTAEQWNFKPSPEVWSVGECAEHIALTEDLLRGMIEGKVLAAGPGTVPAIERKERDAKVLKMITDRSFKAKAPEQLHPQRQFATPEAALAKFRESREKTLALVNSRSDLRDHSAPHPVLKELDAYQWTLVLSGHVMRHTAQIQEVKASPGYPKGN